MSLREKIAALRTSEPDRAVKLESKLNALIQNVLYSAYDADSETKSRANLEWNVSRNRTEADRARVQILEMLLEK